MFFRSFYQKIKICQNIRRILDKMTELVVKI